MQPSTAVGATPHYALIAEDNHPLGPSCVTSDGQSCTAIYGFTNREAYDRFRGSGRPPWRPYPLVVGHLERMLARPGLQLVVLDAPGQDEPTLAAAAADAVLAAQSGGALQLTAGYDLSRSPDGTAYLVEPAPQ
ncbi:hypothetical protein Pla175_26270 [Pirellulimonas nuda]|uniref:SseB protein N-terminal domain-containing protein n=1 Tax=Pirellulimonas nuda TaxID=2528009 RepID=A0A518DCQ3_9BACT|nr:hypothetical protein [Pirellulimonas nuda]QDU89240.1 hypothetical protein Pla175_26270 [Pirellulimonas nuda]